jgi:hypothetical protein
MGGRKLAVNTTAMNEDGQMVQFEAGTVVSTEVAKGITNPKAWGDEPDADEDETPKKAPAKKAAPSKPSK